MKAGNAQRLVKECVGKTGVRFVFFILLMAELLIELPTLAIQDGKLIVHPALIIAIVLSLKFDSRDW